MSQREPVTIGIVNFNGGSLIAECLRSVLAQDYQAFVVTVVDNCSTDKSLATIREHFPQVELVERLCNDGPNPARNLIISRATTRLVLLLDNDVVLPPDCLSALVAAMGPDVAVCGPRIMDYDRRHRVQQMVNYFHYTGAVIRAFPDAVGPVEGQSVGGAALLVDKQKAMAAGLYDEDFFFGLVDNDFCMKQLLAGHKILHVPGAVVYHRDKERGLSKVFYQIRNRWFFLLEMYRWRTLMVIWPALLVFELNTLVFLTCKGKVGDYLRAIPALIGASQRLLEKRHGIQKGRRVADRELLRSGPIYVRPELSSGGALRLARRLQDVFFDLYWRVARKLI